ncbi:hypothetical protein [Vibrio owensii]|uniref:hypothetical protein n=1 Tax=Vibrio owensii TaxID=696485 RepID=UPI0022DD6568|nr:hypothetical protein [Vibrio owensii]MDA0385570.1 hypothetical protein [Vibrio owensii]
MNEPLNKLKTDIKNETEQQGYSLQSSFTKHVHEIISLKNSGVQYQFIHRNLELDISLSHFHNLLLRAKKKRTNHENKNASPSPEGKNAARSSANEQKASPQQTHKPASSIDIVEWKMIMPDISETLVRDITREGYSTLDVEEWIRANQIPNSSALRRFFSALKVKK